MQKPFLISPPNPVDEAIDLVEFAKKIRRKYPDLAGKILRLREMHSVVTDLEQAKSALQLRHKFKPREGEVDDNTIVNSLFVSALVSYCRATGTSSNHRKFSFSASKWYNDDELIAHKKFMKFRNDSVAHYGPGSEIVEKEMRRDDVILLTDPENDISKIFTFSRWLTNAENIFDQLELLISRSLIISSTNRNEKIDDLFKNLVSLIEKDNFVIDYLNASKFKIGKVYFGLSPKELLYLNILKTSGGD